MAYVQCSEGLVRYSSKWTQWQGQLKDLDGIKHVHSPSIESFPWSLSAKPAAAADAVKPPEPEPEPGAEPESKKVEISASESPKRALETAPESPKSFDWLVKKLGSGNDVDQAQAFMKMDPTEQMEILIRVDLLNGDMCKKKLSKAERDEPLHDRLLKKWIKRIRHRSMASHTGKGGRGRKDHWTGSDLVSRCASFQVLQREG